MTEVFGESFLLFYRRSKLLLCSRVCFLVRSGDIAISAFSSNRGICSRPQFRPRAEYDPQRQLDFEDLASPIRSGTRSLDVTLQHKQARSGGLPRLAFSHVKIKTSISQMTQQIFDGGRFRGPATVSGIGRDGQQATSAQEA